MNRNLFRAAEILWIICALVPIAAAVLKNKKPPKKRELLHFSAGFTYGFMTYIFGATILLVLLGISRSRLFACLAAMLFVVCAFYILFKIFYTMMNSADGAFFAALGISELSLLICAFRSIRTVEDILLLGGAVGDARYHSCMFFILTAAVRAFLALIPPFAARRLYSADENRGKKTAAISAAVTAFCGFAADFALIVLT